MKKSKKIKRLLNKGFRGYPVATIAYYGPDDKKATKVAVGIVPSEDAEPDRLKKWFNEDIYARRRCRMFAVNTYLTKRNLMRYTMIYDKIIQT